MGNQSTTNNSQFTVVLKQIEPYGFKYFGLGENNEPLVIAPNGQVIPLKIAYEFVQQQLKKTNSQSSGGSLESMPSMTSSVDTAQLESKIESTPEKESNIEKAQESANNIQKAQQAANPVSTSVSADKNQNITIKMPIPFDEGFKVTKFDPTDPSQVNDYIQSNKNGSASNSSTWLAQQFEKFLLEYKSKK